VTDEYKPWDERSDDDSVDDIVAMFRSALNPEEIPSEEFVLDEVVGRAWRNFEEAGLLGNYVFVGEVINKEGVPQLMVMTSDDLPSWIARGMLHTADDYLGSGLLE